MNQATATPAATSPALDRLAASLMGESPVIDHSKSPCKVVSNNFVFEAGELADYDWLSY